MATAFFGGNFFGGEFFSTSVPAARGTAGWLAPPYTGYETRPRTDRDIRRMREELGLVERAAEIIEEVAQRQAASLVTDEQKRFEELARKLELEKIGWESRYLELLNKRRQYLIDREIAMRIQRKYVEDQNAILLMMAVSA